MQSEPTELGRIVWEVANTAEADPLGSAAFGSVEVDTSVLERTAAVALAQVDKFAAPMTPR